jgi:hypothetical protein
MAKRPLKNKPETFESESEPKPRPRPKAKPEGINPAALSAALAGDFKNALIASTPGGIEAQEAQGQRDLVGKCSKLPIDGTSNKKEFWEKLGFKFTGKTIDKIFYECLFPIGWQMKATEHSMWSTLLDDKDRPRASIFFKAAFYDYNSFIRLKTRFEVNEYFQEGPYDPNNRVFKVVVMDAGKPIQFFGPFTRPHFNAPRDEYLKITAENDKFGEQARAWLFNNWPLWQDVAAYWD